MATKTNTQATNTQASEKPAQQAEELQPIKLVLPDAKYTPTVPYVSQKKVVIELFKDDYRYKEPLFVGINGRFMLIQRGVPVEVDEYIADFIEQMKKEEARIMRRVEAEEKEYLEKTASLGA